MVEYLNEENNIKFNNIEITWNNKDVSIIFLKEGWISESYIVIRSYNNDSRVDIKSIFLVFKEDNIIKKERLDKNKVLKLSYKEFIEAMSDRNLKINEGSDNYEYKNIEKIELRTRDAKKLFPTVEGVERIMEVMKWEVSI